jgi:ribosomal protein S18 acetylase RimI-like enzyme
MRTMAYFRRFRMEFDLAKTRLPPAVLPPHYAWSAWSTSLLERHAAVKFESFRDEIDSLVFPCLSTTDGCRQLMRDISRQQSFVPRSTWLITYRSGDPWDYPVDCATIQGMSREDKTGAVQNVGVVAEHRGQGLGRALVLQSLHGFRRSGIRLVSLEVTADNRPAVALYRSLGFRLTRTLYRPMPAAAAVGY